MPVVIETPEYKAGRQAWEEGRPLNHNPYFVTNSTEWRDWREGWKEELEESEISRPISEEAQYLGYRAYEAHPRSSRPSTICKECWDESYDGPIPDWWERAFKRGWHEARNDAEMEFG